MIDQYVAIILTVLVVLLNMYSCINSFRCALYLESHDVWNCKSLSVNCAVKILLVHGSLALSLVFLKAWTLVDVFLPSWYSFPHNYHVRSYAFLTENAGVAILGFLLVDFIKATGKSCREGNADGEIHSSRCENA